MTWELLLLFVGGLAFLVVGGDLLVRGASRLALALGIPPIIVGLTIVAFGTSAPELAVSLQAAFLGNADIAVSNVVGSNIFNILFVLGLSALASPLIIHSQVIARELPLVIAISVLMYLFSLGGVITRVEGSILFSLLIAYTAWLVFETQKKKKANKALAAELEKELLPVKKEKTPLMLSLFLVVAGLAIIILGAEWLVTGAVKLAQSLGVSDTVIGLTIVAAGTSLPEVVASVIATLKGERDIAVGNVIGSNIYNILAVLGLSGAIVPGGLNVNPSLLAFDIPVMLGVTIICWPFFKTGNRLSRTEGFILLSTYVAYTSYLVVQATKT